MRAEKGKGRPAALQPSQNKLPRSSSLLSSHSTAVKAADSDSDERPAGRSLLTAAGGASQRSRQQTPRAEARPAAAPTAAAASSDSDDDLLHAAHAKQSQLLSSKQLSQATAVIAGRSLPLTSTHPRQGASGASLPRETTSKGSAPVGKTVPQGLFTQTSLQRSKALAGGNLAGRQKATAQSKTAAQSDADSDEEHWAGISTRAARPRTQVQVSLGFNTRT